MPKTSRQLTVHPLALREVKVERTVDVTPGMRRVTLAGEQLSAYTTAGGLAQPAFVSPGFDDEIRLVFCYPGQAEPVLPVQKANGVLVMPKDPRPLSRVYSVRRWDPETRKLDIDFVKHGIGIGTTWADRARPGDRIHFFGPGASRSLPEADWLLVAGDDTAVPAIARLLEELPGSARAQVFIEIAEPDHRQELRELPGVEVTWLVRDGAEAGTTTLLPDAVKGAAWWEGRPFAWVAGEQAAVRDIRRLLVEDRGMPKPDIEFTGYWRRGEVVALAGDAAVPDPERNTAAFERFHDLTELIPPIAIRTAVTLGIGDLISRAVTSVADLAAKSGADERALGKLLRYLHSLDVLTETSPGHYSLSGVGEFMANDFWIETLHEDGMSARQQAGIYGLTESIRTGKASYATVTGHSFDELRREQWYEDKFLDVVARNFAFTAVPFAASPALNGVEHLVIHSGGASVLARELLATRPGLRITICALPAQADWLARDLPDTIPDEAQRSAVTVIEQSMFEPSPTADAVLIAAPLMPLADADTTYLLRQAAKNLTAEGRVLFIEHTFDTDDLDEHDGEADLLALTRHGGGLRTEAEMNIVIDQAGLRITNTSPVGRAFTLRELAPIR